jgi:hypothetical protein
VEVEVEAVAQFSLRGMADLEGEHPITTTFSRLVALGQLVKVTSVEAL